MNTNPTSEQIADAIRRSGYLMEQEVGTQLENLGFHVWTNWAFEDADEGKSREIDVRAVKRVVINEEAKLAAFVEAIVECKNNAYPFVFIGRPKNELDRRDAPNELMFPLQEYRAEKPINQTATHVLNNEAFFHLGFHKLHYAFTKDSKAVQFCRIERKGKRWHADHGGMYDALFYPLAKAVTARKHEVTRPWRSGDWRYFNFFIPMVVVNGDIYYVDSTKNVPEPTKTFHVSFKREIQSEKLKGTFAIDFVQQSQLELFFGNCIQPLIDKMVDLVTNHPDRVLAKSFHGKTHLDEPKHM